MFFTSLLCILAFETSHTQWAQDEVTRIFEVLYSEGAAAAEQEVLAQGTTAFDFGIDLVGMNQHSQALSWFSAMSATNSDPQFVFGKAWVLREKGDFAGAMKAANVLTSDNSELVQARAHYLLGTIHREVGSHEYATVEFRRGLALFDRLGKDGGIRLCQMGLGENFGKSIPTFPGSWPPPSDRDDS